MIQANRQTTLIPSSFVVGWFSIIALTERRRYDRITCPIEPLSNSLDRVLGVPDRAMPIAGEAPITATAAFHELVYPLDTIV